MRYSFPSIARRYLSTLGLSALGLAVVLQSGCSLPYVNRHIEGVNAEYQELSAYSYQLEFENQKLCDEIETLKAENEELRGGAPRRRTGPLSAPLRSTTPRATTPSATTPRLPRTTNPAPPSVEVPEVEIPDANPAPTLPPMVPPANSPRLPAAPNPLPRGGGASSMAPRSSVSSQKPADNSLPLLPSAPKPPRPILEDPPPEPTNINNLPASELPPPANGPALTPEPIDGKVTHLFLNPILTRGANFDSQPGDDGLALVLEPRNRAGEYVPHSGPISIVVLDPTKSGDSARLARWTLDEKLVRQRVSRASQSRGIHLQLPWAGAAPETHQVKLFVRYETPDGRKVEAQHDLVLNPSATASQRWTPRAGDRPRTELPAAPQFATEPARTLDAANPPLPAPAIQSDLTKVTPPAAKPPAAGSQVIQEPGAAQTNVATKQPEAPVAETPAPLLAPPPAKQPARPQWQPFR